MEAATELPAYRSHKIVRAAKITAFRQNGQTDMPDLVLGEIGGIVTLLPDWHAKHKPQVGGYYVVYADGYQSFSPAKAFEEGNTLIGGSPSIYLPAINALERAAETCEHNAPIQAAEGDAEQAARSKANGEGYRVAVVYLETLSA